MEPFVLRAPHEIIFGPGAHQELKKLVEPVGKRPLLITGRSAISQKRAAHFVSLLAAEGLQPAVFSAVEPEPSLETVERARQTFQAHQADVIIAVGGGSAIDVGKATGALAFVNEPVAHIFSTGRALNKPGAPIFALPTTAGTGAEVTPNAVLSDPGQKQKASIRGRALLPCIAIVDPELTWELPREQTIYSGLDALTQAIESYTSKGANVVSDMWAAEATARIARAIRRVAADGADTAAREDMALGSLLAGLALASARLGLVHGLAHPLGALYHLPHGRVCGWLLPYVMRFNLPAAEKRYAELAARIGLPPNGAALVEWAEQLTQELGVSGSWKNVGLREEDFAQIISVAVSAGSSQYNPRPVTEENVHELLQQLL